MVYVLYEICSILINFRGKGYFIVTISSIQLSGIERRKYFRISHSSNKYLINMEPGSIKFPDYYKKPGTSLRSEWLKLPVNVDKIKAKVIKQQLQTLGVSLNPPPTEEMSQNLNELRNDIAILNELKRTLSACTFELQAIKLKYDALRYNACNPNQGESLEMPAELMETEGESFSLEPSTNAYYMDEFF